MFRVVMDLESLLYLDGATLDFSDGLEGPGFHFTTRRPPAPAPAASRSCCNA